MSPDLQSNLETNQKTKRGREKGVKATPLSEQYFTHQLMRLEKLLNQCGDRDRQKLLLDTLSKAYQ